MRRLDLADPLLLLASSGVRVDELAWLEAPPAAAVEAARALLAAARGDRRARRRSPRSGGACCAFRCIRGRRACVVEAEARGVGREACVVAALVGERDLVWQRPRRAELSGDSDLLADLDRFVEAARGGLQPDRARSLGLDAGAAMTIDRVRRQLEPLVGSARGDAGRPDAALRQSILAGYPDRVARRRRKGEPELLLSGGGTAQLNEASVVRDADLMVVVDAEQRSDRASGAIVARSVTAIEADWLIDVAADRIREVRRVRVERDGRARRGRRAHDLRRSSCSTSGAPGLRSCPTPTPRPWRARCTRRRARAARTPSSTRRRSSGCAAASPSCARTCPRPGCPT